MAKHVIKLFTIGQPHHFSFSIPNIMAIFQWGPLTAAKFAIFGQYLALGSMTAGASNVVNSFDHGVKFITTAADDNCHASVNLVYHSKGSTSLISVDG